MKLVEPSMRYEEQIADYRRAFLDSGSSMDGCGPLRRYEKIGDWLAEVERMKCRETVPEGLVPAVLYLGVREEDDRVVGMLQIRLCFNEYLEKYAGHIGYSVRPDERRKGFATQMLKQALPLCRRFGLSRVLISCIRENEASRMVILRCGGVYESTVFEPEHRIFLERYWIDLSEGPGENETVTEII